jgi:hypothetical protein
MTSTLGQLERFARARVRDPRGRELCAHLGHGLDEATLTADPWVPEDFALGYHTPHWRHLNDEQRLALNHWTYFMMYFRIAGGEVFVLHANGAIADFLDSHAPDVAALLRLENHEERDHLRAFATLREVLARRWGLEGMRVPVKPARRVAISPRVLRWLTGQLGADFIVTYYLGRGIVNHMGKGFETAISHDRHNAAVVRELSRLHTIDENRHMAVSRMMAECAFELAERRGQRNRLYAKMTRGLRRAMVWHTLSDQTTTAQERAMSRRALGRVPVLRPLGSHGIAALIDDHFSTLTGIERAKNATMGPFNDRILARSCISNEDKRQWREQITANQGRLRFFGDGGRTQGSERGHPSPAGPTSP